MLDHIFLPVTDVSRAICFYEKALSPLGVHLRVDFDGADGPPGHPDLKGFGKDGRIPFWLKQGTELPVNTVHVGFIASSREEVDAAYKAAIDAGAKDNGAPGIREYYDPRYYAANVFDLDGHSLEFVYKSWQHQAK